MLLALKKFHVSEYRLCMVGGQERESELKLVHAVW